MTTIVQGYELVECLNRNGDFSLYRGVSTSNRQSVLIKVLTSQLPKQEDITRVIHEYQIAKDLQIDGILRPLRLERHQHVPILIFEPFAGVILQDYLKTHHPDVPTFLRIAIRLAHTLAGLHQHHVIHKDVHPGTILIHPQTSEVKLTGLGAATVLSKEYQHDLSPYELEGTLPYLSPEQTGRVNRALDYRTDLYSLGVTFYEMLTGKLPFEANDPMEWVHAHIAKKPTSPESHRAAIPRTLSNIVMKLLAKTPESRYQSAYGLQKDLEHCLSQWNRSRRIEPFTLAREDARATFEMPQKLYGRETEVDTLYRAFDRVSRGAAEFVLITGVSGIGKTALVGEVQKRLVKEKGYFTSGKFDQLQRHVPYAPLIQAFKGIIRQIMAEGEDRMSAWKQSILDAIAPNGQVLIDVFPELEWLIGKQPAVQSLPAIEAQNRFHLVFQQFVGALTKNEHPLVLFLDDLQWADAASLNLVHTVLTHVKSEYLLIIGAYRDNEVGLSHPFPFVLDELQQSGVNISRISLAPLAASHVTNWIADTVHAPVKQAHMLSDTVFHITGGNPFFVQQLMHSLYREQRITFDVNSGEWQWHAGDLPDGSFTQDVVAFMTSRVKQLAPQTQAVLQMAACIGNRFDLHTLSIIYEKSPVDTAQDLWEALEAGLILPLDPAYKWQYPDEAAGTIDGKLPQYRFLHDRVQQAVYSTLSADERQTAHYNIGRLLLENTDMSERENLLFDIVNHLNIGQERIKCPADKVRLAGLNQRAGQRAREAAAFEAALTYFRTGLALLKGDRWDNHYDLTMALMLGRGECEYLNRHFAEAEAVFRNILQHARTRKEKLYVYNLQMTLYTHVGDYEAAVEAGMKGIHLFGWKVPSKPSKLMLIPEIAKAKWHLGKRKAKDLADLPQMANEENRLLMQFVANLNAPAYFIDQNLVSLLVLKAFRFTLKHGHTDTSALTYTNYALFLSAGFGDLSDGYEFGRLALTMADKSGIADVGAVVYFIFGGFVNHWKNHMEGNAHYLERSQQLSIEAGNLHQAGAASSFILMSSLIKGNNIVDIIAEIDRQLDLVNQIKSKLTQDFLTQVKQWLACLNNFDLQPDLDNVHIPEDEASKIPYYTILLQMAYLFDKPDRVLQIIGEMEEMVNRTFVTLNVPEYYFYHSLWLARFYPNAHRRQKKQYRKWLYRNLQKMKRWAHHCPDNYWHKYALMRAECARIQGEAKVAASYYEQAIRSAEESGFQQNAAIANECAANFYRTKNMSKVAQTYMTEAYLKFLKWGAVTKAHALETQSPELLMSHMLRDTAATKEEIETAGLDLQTIIKASQTISSEIVLEQLLKRLMAILLENAGADKGFLILQEEDGLFIEAAGGVKQECVTVLQAIPALDDKYLSSAIVQYVIRTQEPVVLADAANEGMFTKDPYVVEHQPKSILCMPILFQSKLSGVLYVENNVTTHAFTPERLNVLSLLSAQTAISIENARLYAQLEQKVQARTQELERANRQLEKTNEKLARMQQSRRRLLSNISHDLRTPITSIQGYIESILDGVVESPEQQKYYLQRSYKRLIGMNRMIQDLFDLSRLEAGQVAFEFEIIPADQLVRQLYLQYEFDVKKAGLTFELQLPDPAELANRDDTLAMIPPDPDGHQGLYPLVEVDPGRMEQVVGNLISNAIKHTPAGGTIHVSMTLKPGEVLIKVADSGSGIPAGDLPYIFDRFYSENPSRNGSGLGLAICKEIITFHRGRMWAESILGKGATFCFTLPVFKPDLECVSQSQAKPDE